MKCRFNKFRNPPSKYTPSNTLIEDIYQVLDEIFVKIGNGIRHFIRGLNTQREGNGGSDKSSSCPGSLKSVGEGMLKMGGLIQSIDKYILTHKYNSPELFGNKFIGGYGSIEVSSK